MDISYHIKHGSLQVSPDLSSFVKNHVNDFDATEKIFVVYNGGFTHLSLLIRKLNEAGYNKFDKTRFVQDLQLIGIGNLDHEGSWKICDGARTSYVDYGDGVYENTLKPYCAPSDSIVVKSSEEMQSFIVRSAIYYIDLITKKDRDEVVLLYQPFPISIIAREGALTLSVLTTVEAGTTIPSIKESILLSETNSLIVYCSQLKDSLSMIDMALDSWTLTDTLFDLSSISIDSDGKVVFFDELKENSVSLIDMLSENSIDNISEYDTNNKQDTKENPLIVVLIGLVIVSAAEWLLLDKLKEEAKCAIQGTSDKIIANSIRKKYKKYRDIVIGIGLLSVIICVVLIFMLVPSDFTWNWIVGGGCLYLFMAIFWSVRRSQEKHESPSVSLRTLSTVNLDDSFVLYLRGFKQDDYMSGGRINEKVFSEEVLFSKLNKKMKTYAIGMTKELYAPTGAERIYFNDDEWKDGVKVLMEHSQAIIINIHNSENCLFEIKQSIRHSQKTLCIVTNVDDYFTITEKVPEIYWPNSITPNSFFFLGDREVYKYSLEEMENRISSIEHR